jgi:hypothetical protein
MSESNPLGQYFRKPGLNVRLPSGGKFYAIPPKMTVDGEIAVFPMTAKDELLVKNADSLLNGDALVNLIRSCVPDIANPSEIPNPDLDAVLLAIRKATYGSKLDINANCPCFDWSGAYSIDIDNMMQQIVDTPDFNSVELSNGLQVNVKPNSLNDQNKLGMTQFENIRKLQSITDTTDESVKVKINNDITARNIILTQEIIANAILNVSMPNGTVVSDTAMIKEWLNQLEVGDFKLIEDKIGEINKSGTSTSTTVKCGKEGCERMFDIDFTLDPVNFFAQGS